MPVGPEKGAALPGGAGIITPATKLPSASYESTRPLAFSAIKKFPAGRNAIPQGFNNVVDMWSAPGLSATRPVSP